MTAAPTPPPKWVRATQLIDQLDGEIRAYLDRAAVPDSTTEGQVVLRILASPPESLSLLLGDALQNLHSALDHEVHRQATARMGAAWPGLERCAFPTFDDASEYAAQRKRLIGGLSPEVQAAVDRFQTCDPDPEPAVAMGVAQVQRGRDAHRDGRLPRRAPGGLAPVQGAREAGEEPRCSDRCLRLRRSLVA